jgi:hypothetical protein
MKAENKKCVAGCKAYSGGEMRHHKDCDFYPDSLSKKYDELESQLEKERLKLNTDDPYKYVLTNPKGDTFTFNPQRGIGEELNDFLYGYFETKEDER